MAKRPPRPMSEQVLDWLQHYMESRRLGPGDPLPKELEIAKETGASRSSVREALTALKVLGIIRSRRRGGIRIVRGLALLGIREYLVENFTDRRRADEAIEFRAVLEQGLSGMVAKRIGTKDIAALRKIVESVRNEDGENLLEAEERFHSLLARASGNRLAHLLSDLYRPVFRTYDTKKPDTREEREVWYSEHIDLVEALEKADGAGFVRRMRDHVASYLPAQGN